LKSCCPVVEVILLQFLRVFERRTERSKLVTGGVDKTANMFGKSGMMKKVSSERWNKFLGVTLKKRKNQKEKRQKKKKG